MRKATGRIPIVVYSGTNPALKGKVWVRKRTGDEKTRGFQRRGIRARNLSAEADFGNEKTSPQVEVPRVVIETMRAESNRLTATDYAVFFRLFAHARLHGMRKEMHSIRVSELQRFLGVRSVKRIRESLDRLASERVSYHFNHPSWRGRISVPLIDMLYIGSCALRGSDEIDFSLPAALRDVVLDSAEYAWVDLNALARFDSKFTAPIYLKLCWLAGLNRAEWRRWTLSRDEIRELLRMRPNVRKKVFYATMELVHKDLQSLDGPRKRFEIEMLWPTSGPTPEWDRFEFFVTSSKRKLREVKPTSISDGEYERIADRSVLPLGSHQYPTVTRLRQAATLASVSRPGITTFKVSDMWKTDVWGAVHYSLPVAGMTADAFLEMIRADGADGALEHWVERRDFGVPDAVKTVTEPSAEPDTKPASAPVSLGSFVPAEVYYGDERGEDEDDLRMGEAFGEFYEAYLDGDEPPDFAEDGDFDMDFVEAA